MQQARRWAMAMVLTMAAPAAAETAVRFTNAEGIAIEARLLLPAGQGPFPAVVALHGCGGRDNARGALARRHRDWADRWVGQGHAVLLPDSFGSRGLGPQCSVADRTVRPGRERASDVAAARVFLQARSDIRADRITLVGWSNGGSTVLYALSARRRPGDGRPDFLQAIAFYPGCRTPLARGLFPRLPLTILVGEADNWTPPGPCRDFAMAARAAGAQAEIVTYPGAFHGFDDPASRPRERSGLAYTADGSGRAMVGTDPAARADAIRRIGDLLRRR